jgi:hypothetical protein
MHSKDLIDKYQQFTSDYKSGMDRSSLCAKYGIADDSFDSFLVFLQRKGFLSADLTPRSGTGEPGPASKTILKVASLGRQLKEWTRPVWIRLARHPVWLALYLLSLSSVIVATSQGANTLTSRMWDKSPPVYETIQYKNVLIHVNKDNPVEGYLELPTKNDVKKLKITWREYNFPKALSYDSLHLVDNTNIPVEDRAPPFYLLFIYKTNVAPAEIRIRQKDFIKDPKDHTISGFMGVEAQQVPAHPVGFTNRMIIHNVTLKTFRPAEPSTEKTILKVIATPITLHCDIVLIPLGAAVILALLLTHIGT